MLKYLPLSLFFCFSNLAAQTKSSCAECGCFTNKFARWAGEIDAKGKEYLIRGDSLKKFTYPVDEIIKHLNSPSMVELKLVKVKADTVYLKIINTTYFTQQMGFLSDAWYLAGVVYTITENKKYNTVYIDFIEGDHSGPPGFFNRNYFLKQFKVCD
jgi:hypothetical protein